MIYSIPWPSSPPTTTAFQLRSCIPVSAPEPRLQKGWPHPWNLKIRQLTFCPKPHISEIIQGWWCTDPLNENFLGCLLICRSQTPPRTYWFRITKRGTQKSTLLTSCLDDAHAQLSIRTTTYQSSPGITLTTAVLQSHRALWSLFPPRSLYQPFLPSLSSRPAHAPSSTTSTLLAISVSLPRWASFVQQNPGPRTVQLLTFSTGTHWFVYDFTKILLNAQSIPVTI